MARTGLGLTLDALSASVGVRVMTISKLERGQVVIPATVEKLRAWFVAAGVEFINGGASLGVKVPRKD